MKVPLFLYLNSTLVIISMIFGYTVNFRIMPQLNLCILDITQTGHIHEYLCANRLLLQGVQGSGPNGRIIASDLSDLATTSAPAAVPAAVPGSEYTDVELSNMRKVGTGSR